MYLYKMLGFFCTQGYFFYLPINFEHDDMNDKDVYYLTFTWMFNHHLFSSIHLLTITMSEYSHEYELIT